MTAILKEEPEPLTLACPDAPAIVGRLLDRCLAKPREERPGSGRELVFVLEVAGLSVAAARPAQVTASLRGRRVRAAQVLGWIIAGALGAALAAIALLTLAPRGGAPARRPPMVSSVVLPSGAGSLFWWNSAADVALSPDGSLLAYAGPGQDRKPALWLRDLTEPILALPGRGSVGEQPRHALRGRLERRRDTEDIDRGRGRRVVVTGTPRAGRGIQRPRADLLPGITTRRRPARPPRALRGTHRARPSPARPASLSGKPRIGRLRSWPLAGSWRVSGAPEELAVV
jgi:hypothetical protein